jgi:putative tryptophan/tyrosine transport system substrate-binding protein
MSKKITGLALGAMLLVLSVPAQAQQAEKIPRIGILEYRGPSDREQVWEAFRQSLRELGYVEGKNIAIESRFAEGKEDRLRELAAELVRLKVDIIVAAASAAAAKDATKTIPIVFVAAADPVASGIVASLARPGGNVTGMTNLTSELGGKRLELLKEAVSKVARVAVLYDPTGPSNVREVKGSASRGACAAVNYSALGGTGCGRFREGLR